MKLRKNEILVLRTCTSDMTGTHEKARGFVWPRRGRVEAPDWRDDDECGGGLHGLPWGAGDIDMLSEGGIWLVVRVSTAPGRYRSGQGKLDGKCKFRSGTVVYAGDRSGAVRLIDQYKPADAQLVYAEQIALGVSHLTQTAGHDSTQRAGSRATQTAGNHSIQGAGSESTQTAGYGSTQKAGSHATQTAGLRATQTAGHHSTQRADENSVQRAGDSSIQEAGFCSTQTAGNGSTQLAGYGSIQTAECRSTQIAGCCSTQTAEGGSIQMAGHHSSQRADCNSYQRGGIYTIQTTAWLYDSSNAWHSACRVVTEAEADRWYHVAGGAWTEVTDAATLERLSEIEAKQP